MVLKRDYKKGWPQFEHLQFQNSIHCARQSISHSLGSYSIRTEYRSGVHFIQIYTVRRQIVRSTYTMRQNECECKIISALHRDAFCQFLFWCIYYYGSNKSTGKETGKTHLCTVSSPLINVALKHK